METGPIIINLNVKKTLTNSKTVNGKEITEINIKQLIKRPILKKIVFIMTEIDRVIVYEGDVDYEAHKNDSNDSLITALLAKIDLTF